VKRHAVFRTPAAFDELHDHTAIGVAGHYVIAKVPPTHYCGVGTEVEAAIHHAVLPVATHAIAAKDWSHVTVEGSE
jgi:hypothetical protein